GIYTVVAYDREQPFLGCKALVTYEVEENNPVIELRAGNMTLTNNDNCSGTPNGSVQITGFYLNNAFVAVTDPQAANYTITWDAAIPGANLSTSAGSAFDDVASNLPAGTYNVSIQQIAAAGLCPSAGADISVTIKDDTANPVISLTSLTDDTFCDPSADTGDGQITVDVDGNGSTNYYFRWWIGTDTTIVANEITDGGYATAGTIAANADSTQILGLPSGIYTVVAYDREDPNNGCKTRASYEVEEDNTTPTLDISTIQSNTQPDTLCTGNSGTIVINDADITGSLNDYNVDIRQGNATGPSVGAFNGNGSPTITINNLSSGDYYILATNNTTQCSVATAIVNVKDSTRNPQVTRVSTTPDNNCTGGTTATGGLEVIINSKFDETDHFTVQWFTGSNATAGNEIAGATSVILSNQSAGQYSVQVTNTNTQCSTVRNFDIPQEDEAIFITDSQIDNVSYCTDNGSFAVLEISVGGTRIDSAQMATAGIYTLEVYTTPGNVLTGTTSTDPNSLTIEGLGADSYYAIVRKTDSNCESDALFFDIVEDIFYPDVRVTVIAADSTCSATGTPAGSLRALADGNDETDTLYTFQWYLGSGTGTALVNNTDPGNGSSPTGVSTATVAGLAAGTYTVEVTNLSSTCTTVTVFDVPSVPADLDILAVSTTTATTCSPGNGSITVTSVSDGAISDYDFDYYDVDPTVGSPTPVFTGNAGAAYTTAQGGIYWVIGTHTTLDCSTPPFEVRVRDNAVYPVITLDDFDAQTNCDPNLPNGRLLVLADGQPENATYDFEWYYGTGTGNPLTSDDYTGGSQLAGANTNELSGIAAGTYTVEVTNNTTGCSITETYEMVDDIPNPIAISTTSSANTNCVNPNGKVAVSVITPAPGRSISDYSYYWFTGNLATVGTSPNPANADYTGSLVENLADGNYVVLVVDQIDNFCQSNATEVTVENATKMPVYELTTSDVTVCFDEKNGYASVSVPNLSTVNITWYNDANTQIGNTFFIDSLDAGMYTLELAHVITGCIASEVFTIQNNAVTPNTPTVIVNNGRDNCQFANGSAIANVDGITNGFLFEWFDPSDMTSPYATGSQVFNLDTTTYLVRATNLATGCQSAETPVQINYEVVAPEYEVIFNNSVCLRTEDGSTNQFTGSAIIGFEEFNLATEYEWRDANGTVVGTDSRLIDAYPGDYTVTFTAENGCTYDAAFTIETSLTIYNGVSANADGKNDFLLIDCIDYFPNNNVKIYNRAGQKIFDIDGYNNTSVRFEGLSNVGGGGLTLPSGTYFYVIDLGTGEDPIQGYLELVR
ncbi:C-terminal domain of CHU protein family protein, partial [Ekhidna lutea]